MPGSGPPDPATFGPTAATALAAGPVRLILGIGGWFVVEPPCFISQDGVAWSMVIRGQDGL